MLQGVTLMGLVAPGESVTIGGPAGPVTIQGEPAAPLVVYRMEGWEPNDTPDGQADEAQGHKVIRLMEQVGQALANDRIDAADMGTLAVSLQIPGGEILQALVPVAAQVIAALENDGKITAQEAMSIAGAIISAVLTMRA